MSILSPAHKSFVSTEIQRELRIGAVRRWGDVGNVKPPHLVLPMGVEPSKPRKLNDGRFLNLWCRDSPFEFEGLHMLPALVDKGKKKMTQGWVVYGGMRHAEPQREMFPRSYADDSLHS